MLVSLQNICKSYGINPTVDVLKGIDLDIQKMTLLQLLGEAELEKAQYLI